MKNLLMTLMSLVLLCKSLSVFAGVKIAVIDSGTDIKHEMLKDKIWFNEKENPTTAKDDDGNDYPNDMNGWNFAENNNQLIDYSFESLYSNTDLFKYFEVQKRQFQMRTTNDDLAWLEAKKKDAKFLGDLATFGNFVHGTHVAGITTLFAKNAEVIGMKLLPTKSPLPPRPAPPANPNGSRTWGGGSKNPDPVTSGKRIEMIKQLLTQLAILNAQNLETIGKYVEWTKAEVANGSFGIGPMQSKMIIGFLFKVMFFRAPVESELSPLITHFLTEVNKAQKSFVNSSIDTLFVFAAGNDGSDNDKFPSAPASVGGDNVVSVAASYGNISLAKFSNYGKTKVDLAAPGVFIKSSIPLNRYLEVSGTSQASPRVAAAAARVIEINEKLSPKEVKRILMETVDYKEFLKDKVVSGGVLNQKRAEFVADYSLNTSLDEALIMGRTKVKDFEVYNPDASKLNGSLRSVLPEVEPISMPTGFDMESFK